jgi:hypothetical protein
MVGLVFASIGLLAVPKTESIASRLAVAAFVLFLFFEVSHPISTALNDLRARITGRPPT